MEAGRTDTTWICGEGAKRELQEMRRVGREINSTGIVKRPRTNERKLGVRRREIGKEMSSGALRGYCACTYVERRLRWGGNARFWELEPRFEG